jgi:hypothetical protein
MVPLKRYNYFTGDISAVAYGVSDIVKFFELAGDNYILITPEKPKESSGSLCLYHHLDNKLIFSDFNNFSELIMNKSNLFRVDLLVFDFWNLCKEELCKYKNIIDCLELKSIIVAKEYNYKTTDDVTDYHLRREYKGGYKSETWITDNINNTSYTIDSLKKSYIRDKKIDHLFGDENNS